jgi:hypothetical protein
MRALDHLSYKPSELMILAIVTVALRGARHARIRWTSRAMYLLNHSLLDVRSAIWRRRHADQHMITRCQGCFEEDVHPGCDRRDALHSGLEALEGRRRGGSIRFPWPPTTLWIHEGSNVFQRLSRSELQHDEIVRLDAGVLDTNCVATSLQLGVDYERIVGETDHRVGYRRCWLLDRIRRRANDELFRFSS